MLDKLRDQMNIVRDQLEELLVHQRVWKQLDEAWGRHQGATFGGNFAEYLRLNHLSYVTTAIRRLIDKDRDSVSLRRIMERLKQPDTLKQVKRENVVARYTDANIPGDIGQRDYATANMMMPGDIHEKDIEADIERMNEMTLNIKDFVDRFVAHHDKRGLNEIVTYGDLDAAVGKLVETYERYRLLIGSRNIDARKVEESAAVQDVIQRLWP